MTLVSGLAATGCSKKRSEKETSPSGKVSESEAAPDKTSGGRVVLPSNEPRYLNPILETRFTRAVPLIFEGLVGLDPALEPVPLLAEKWQRSGDGKSITFTLRKGVEWHDGRPFTSKDVVFTFDAMRKTDAPTVWRVYFSDVEEVEAPDPNTVVVRYSAPYAPALIAWTVGILPEHVYGEGALVDSRGNREPVGTGPFRLSRWEPGKRMLFDANTNWWNGRPKLDAIELRLDIENQFEALRKGELDFAEVPDVQTWSTEAQLPDFRADYEVATVVGSLFRSIAWNLQREPFDRAEVRKALTMALNRPRIIEDVFLSQARPMSAPFFPNMFGANPDIAPHPFDLDQAAKALDQAGLTANPTGDRFAIKIISVANQRTAPNEEMFAIFRRDLAAIGIDLSVEYLSSEEFESRVVLRDFDGAFFGWLPDIPDPDPSALVHSSQIRVGLNFAGYADQQTDELVAAAARTGNRDERKALYYKVHQRLHEELPYTVLYAPYSHFAWSRRLRGVHPEDIGPQPRTPGIAGWSVQ